MPISLSISCNFNALYDPESCRPRTAVHSHHTNSEQPERFKDKYISVVTGSAYMSHSTNGLKKTQMAGKVTFTLPADRASVLIDITRNAPFHSKLLEGIPKTVAVCRDFYRDGAARPKCSRFLRNPGAFIHRNGRHYLGIRTRCDPWHYPGCRRRISAGIRKRPGGRHQFRNQRG